MFLSAIILSLVLTLHAETKGECGSDSAFGMNYDYCIYRNPKSPDVLHYLHMNGGNANSWESEGENQSIRDNWTKTGKQIPNVITFSFGKQWLLTEVPQKDSTSRYYAYINKILPDLEKRLGGFTGRRLLMGDSMGGLNSALVMERAGNLFERVAINCPAITSIGPQASQSEVEAYIQRNQPYASRMYVYYMLNWGKSEFPTEDDWNRHNPIEIGRVSPVLPHSIYVSCGDQDQFGFIEGAGKFATMVAQRGINVVWKIIPGGKHCAVDPSAVADFLIPN